MPSQNNTGRQYDKQHAVTVMATAAVLANRFIGYDGNHAASGGVRDVQGVSEAEAAVGQACSVITGYSALVEASVAIAFGAYIKPAADGTGRAAVGTVADRCGIALGAAAAGELVEVRLITHIHA